jgi:hypothetical protein
LNGAGEQLAGARVDVLLEIDVSSEQGRNVVVRIEEQGVEVSGAGLIEISAHEVGLRRFHGVVDVFAIRECGRGTIFRNLQNQS